MKPFFFFISVIHWKDIVSYSDRQQPSPEKNTVDFLLNFLTFCIKFELRILSFIHGFYLARKGSQSARSGKHGVPTVIIVVVVIAILIGIAVSIYCIRRKRLRQRIEMMTNSGLPVQGKDRESFHYSDLEEYEFTGKTPDLFPPS